MQKHTFFIIGLIGFTLFSCTHLTRGPASLAPSQLQTLEDNYLQALDREAKDVKTHDQSKPVTMSGERLFTESTPKSIVHPFEHGYFKNDERLQIRHPQYYEMTGRIPSQIYLFDDTNDLKYALRIENLSIRNRHKQTKTYDERDSFSARISCDGDYSLRADQRLLKLSAGQAAEFSIYGLLPTRGPISVLYPEKNTNACTLTWTDYRQPGKTYGVRLLRERSVIRKEIFQLRSSFQSCLLPSPSEKLTAIQKFFLTSQYRQMTCPIPVEKIVSHPEPFDGLNAKVEALLGQRLTDAQINAKDPNLDLDFSKAPKLDLIIVSYLVFKSDFSGNLMARLLKWHADHGAQVRIFVSDVLLFEKDEKLVNDLVASNGNIKLKAYYFDAKSNKGSIISQLHRVNHVKLLAGISFDHPENDRVVIGGRNIHDGFVFKSPPSYGSTGKMVDYAGGEEGFSYWRDYEATIYSSEFTREVVGHFYTLWDQDLNNSYVRSWTQNVTTGGKVGEGYFDQSEKTPLVRHYISVPYAEERLIEDLYADMIDHAEKKVLISTPYFRPSNKLAKAIENAVARGVDIKLITRLKLKGDTADIILGDVNKAGVNKFYDKIKVYEYAEPDIILHSKLALIDDQFSFVTSVNLNRRSFVHDTENATMVYSREYNKELTDLVDQYMTLSHQITGKQKIKFWKRIVIELFNDKL